MHTTSLAPVIVWFRRDLRLHDHPALTDALRSGHPVVPLFVLDPRILHGRFASPNRAWFLRGALAALDADLRDRGSGLEIRFGDPREIVPAVAAEVTAASVHVSRDHAPYGIERDRTVAGRLGRSRVAFHAKRGVLVHEPEDLLTADGRPPVRFTPFLRRWEALAPRAVLDAPAQIPAGPAVGSARVDELAFGAPTADPGTLPEPGEAAARRRLARWLDSAPGHGPEAYDRTRDHLADPDATSRLSADLRFGTLSANEVATAVAERFSSTEGGRRYLSELAWRDFYAQLLRQHPRVAHEPFDRRFAEFAYDDDPGLGHAWRDGRTGYPIVDAAMRQLLATGFIPNRARMIAASFLTKDLLIDWRVGEAHFMRHLVDGDPASNLGGWQWASSMGSDAQPYVRVFNPVTQARRFDPDGAYVRRWVPELAPVPTERIHEPWTMSPAEQRASGCAIGVDYPVPVVDHAEARRRTLERFADAAIRPPT
jgi:deoxyribodipyrimidine photo-lyase